MLTDKATAERDAAEAEITESEIEVIRRSAVTTVRRTAEHPWSLSDVNWSEVRPEELTDDDRSIVRFITYVEDHIPAFLSFNLSAFPTTGDISTATYHRNREYARFLFAWANDEEKHASALSEYQLVSEMADEKSLADDLAEVGRQPFSMDYEDPLEAFLYLFMQEKATQLFYQHYRAALSEPVLQQLLRLMARDEARHFAFYSRVIEESLGRAGAKTLSRAKDVLSTFQMPLDGVYDGYWRLALKVVDRVGHDHTEAYEALDKLVRRFVNTLGTPEVDDFGRFVKTVQKMP
ncbi:acyl-ACP desaturase [Streptomyces sp. NPDC001822]|uniref:acyl-ACP desaturase n=1 Tax=Streptomyces sp. NPDC001822 TaxID=3364614 RepID=UPI00369A08DC